MTLGGATVMAAAAPSPFQILFSSEFAVADGAISTVGMVENDFGSASISSGTLLGNGLLNGACVQPIDGTGYTANQWARATILAPSATGGCGLALRADGYLNGYYADFELFGSNKWQMWKRVSNGNGDIVRSAVTTQPSFPYDVLFTAIGTTLTFYVDSGAGMVQVLTATDSSHTIARKPGIFMFSQPTDPRVERFSCGNIV